MGIKRIREEKNLTQVEMAKQLEVDQTAVSQWERGVAMPRIKVALKIVEKFGCSLDDIYETGNPLN